MTLGEIAAVVDGHVEASLSDVRVTAEAFVDSRAPVAGGLFVALAGERTDGHDHAAGAMAHGAAAVLASTPVAAPAVVVGDVLAALARLASHVLRRIPDATVIGITGSSGKTSTKDLVAQLLPRLGPTVAPPGSFNNELGHPYTVLLATPQTRYLVLEYSARGLGHIAALCAVARPDIAVELNVGTAHIGEFGSADVVARAKAELVAGLGPDAVAVLNADDPRVRAMAEATDARVVLTGRAADADVRATDVTLDGRGRPSYILHAAGEQAAVRLPLFGEHAVANSLAAAAVARELGLGVADIAAALGEVRAVSRWRMEVGERADGVTVVNDAYNANPESMAAALRALAAMGADRRTWAVLGGMAELGERAGPEHDALGRLVNDLGIDRLVAVGPQASGVHAGAVHAGRSEEESSHVPDIDAALRLLHDELRPGDVVLVKASRAAGLERLALSLLEGGA